jgi:hypothetical protein
MHISRFVYLFQVDGGSENANNAVLAYLEYLVTMRVCKKIIMTRLPTGHTHEDIDSCFGCIWTWFRGQIFETLDQYKSGT